MKMEFLFRCKSFIRKAIFLRDDYKYLNLFDKKIANDLDVDLALLRKNCHILDKGLHITPFEKGHGKQIYKETLLLFDRLLPGSKKSDPSFDWCRDVIASYERAQNTGCPSKNVPFYNYSDVEKKGIYDFIRSRVSCRNFNGKIINDSIWNEIIELAADAPNGCCRQTSRIYIIKDKEIIGKLKPKIGGATGFSNGIPYLLCVTADLRPYVSIDRMLPYIDASLFVENLVLACRANNVFTTILNFQHASNSEREYVMRCIGIPFYERVILFIAAGYADLIPDKPKRMSINQFRKL